MDFSVSGCFIRVSETISGVSDTSSESLKSFSECLDVLSEGLLLYAKGSVYLKPEPFVLFLQNLRAT